MSSKKARSARSGRKSRTSARPILWIGGAGPPGGAVGRKLVALANSLHWEPLSPAASRSAASLGPALVVVETERSTPGLRSLLEKLTDLKPSTDMVVFQLRQRPARRLEKGFDGTLLKGSALSHQIQLVLEAIEGSRKYKRAGQRAQQRLASAKAQVERLRHLAVRDDLTSLYNLRFFNRSLETEHQRAMRFGRSYALVFLDLDGLREVNSRRGHLAGGQVLQQVGEFLAGRIRRIDLAARIGGDEFVVICPETGKPAARRVADRLRHGIQKLQDTNGKSLGITASIGVAAFPVDGDLPDEVLHRADRALYEAKASGKNRVCCWGDFSDVDDKSLLGSVHGTAKPEVLPDGAELVAVVRDAEPEESDEEPPVSPESLN